eukprot:2585444-Prymnesium_polylepis.1
MAWRAGGRLFSRTRHSLPLAAACGCVLSERLGAPPADCFSFGLSESKRERELRQALEQAKLAIGKELGAGAFATVRLAKCKKSGE